MYADNCEECRKSFKNRHYTWFVCTTCHKYLAINPENKEINMKEYKMRIKRNEDLL